MSLRNLLVLFFALLWLDSIAVGTKINSNAIALEVTSGRSNLYTAEYPLASNEKSMGLGYGWRVDPDTGKTVFHSGIDLLAPAGTSVLAADNGTVAFAAKRGDYGNLVVINHQGGRQSRYAHLGSISVRVGQRVERGETLGIVGATGRPDINESHLHFEVRYNSPKGWVAQDPQPWLGINFQEPTVKPSRF